MEIQFIAKGQLRRFMMGKRNVIPAEVRCLKSTDIAERLADMEWYKEQEKILVYSAIRSEVDLTTFCHKAWKDGKVLFFPRVFGEQMEFYRVDSMSQLTKGSFSVMEPRLKEDADFNNEDMPIAGEAWTEGRSEKTPILVPGVAFSRKGARLGYGKGFYDRYLAVHPSLVPIGVCFDEQLTEQICADEHDYPMYRIMTESESILCVQM